MATETKQVLINGSWRNAELADGKTFQATNPNTNEPLPAVFPVSAWSDCDAALEAAAAAATELRRIPREKIAAFLKDYADRIEAAADTLVEAAFNETGLARSPRLGGVELPRTSNQLRLAAAATVQGDWASAVIDTASGIRSCFESLGPICVFGPNNFPFAFNSVAGGDFAAAIAAGNPVIAKANSSHPETTRLLAEQAFAAAQANGLPAATVQLIYRTGHADGERMVSDPRCGATGYTGSRSAGLALKAAADRSGKPIYLELSSVNPVAITPAALQQRGAEIADEFMTSVLMGTGQFCTNPGMVLLIEDPATETFVSTVTERFAAAPAGTLLSPAVATSLSKSVQILVDAGAERLAGDGKAETDRCAVSNTLLKCSAEQFLTDPETFQTEAFGNASLLVVAKDLDQATSVLDQLEGNLTGCLYTATDDSDEAAYDQLAFALTPRVGRLLNDKMPTGVAVSPAMNHGGPFPATGHPGFTAVGIPAAISRFAKLTSYDNVRDSRLPALLANKNPTGSTWRYVDGNWQQGDVAG
ncbi:NADP-dependent fatty aldehyde dehydrogenase [Roseimaritima multifibrata]|uniref:NADP-dependent fatty aldehyde dehydrogenase n=1 Tax=Roseimaritima multifibrata TaxID=1930274 RepID=A0A517MBX9_9BACT|nr:aldehyde dehydrogenase (NADP(+)) [Roseimaritima multifibrata]QDS92382.1 NADP-dependent fatty aldehyde dehydrogenase [Roseimaritima multifibrata]